MRSYPKRNRFFRAVTLILLAAVSAVPLLLAESAWAGQRKFLVILAHPPKQYGGAAVPPGGLPNPQLITNEYFDTINPEIDSFAEYWKEISYGDVTISGRVTDWIFLPWAIQPQQPMSFFDLDESDDYRYGKGEKFDNQKAMVVVDINGNGPGGADNGPRRPDDNPPYARGAGLSTSGGQPVWTAGERFLDMDGDGRWDGFDEARNAMDWSGGLPDAEGNPTSDDKPDLKGPWYDLNNNGIPLNTANCTYLPDSDNDGNPDCCPNGPGTPGCEGIGPDGARTNACPATTWPGANNTIIVDCNGNLIPDACDISCTSQACQATGFTGVGCGLSKDRLPVTSGGDRCETPTINGIPDECQFVGPETDCVGALPSEDDPCFGQPVCVPLTGNQVRTPVPRCEFDDGNGSGTLDVVEPFENFLARAKLKADEREDKPDFCVNRLSNETITNNFPGQGVNTVIARGTARPIFGSHDPLGKLPRCYCDHPVNTKPCGTDGAPAGMCKAGEHAQYDPPDSWVEAVSMKMRVDRDPRVELDLSTPEPPWYKQAWRDRYNGADPPPWNPKTPKVTLITSATVTGRREFIADRGGLRGDGRGWPGAACGTSAFPVEFKTAPCGDFEATCSPTGRILPEESNGVGQALTVFDGVVEFDDMPSSKYHRAGDQQLGEVTSPFNTDIWGQDRGTNNPASPGGPDKVIPAAGPYATHLHGQLGRDAGNQLLIELLTWRQADGLCVGGVNAGDPCNGNGDCPGSTCKEYSNDGAAWEAEYGPHPYAGPSSGLNLGFRDYNLDGLIDLGESVAAGTENYVDDPEHNTPRGSESIYPWNRRRLLEDCIEVLDDVIDFDDFVDQVAMDAVTCGAPLSAPIPAPFQDARSVNVAGVCSGIVLLPTGAHQTGDFRGATNFFDPELYPIHNEDGLNDPAYTYAQFPTTGTRQLNWNLLFHDLVLALPNSPPISAAGALTDYSAHEWLHTWEHFPDLYDYDIYNTPPGIENCPMGAWDIMSRPANLVHPTPILKESGCTDWVEPVDLTTVLTPGVDKAITLPVAEFVRDNSYYFFENEDLLGERYYFWSAGSGFDGFMPGEGVLILHTDVGSNPDALPQQQRSGDRPQYLIVQADGDNDLLTCVNRGDDGDPWPGSSGNTHFDCDTLPASQWYADNACTGLEVLDIVQDGTGSARVTFNWTPTSIPSLKFVDPPGGVTVGTIYQIRTETNDVFGGTSIRFYYKRQDAGTPEFTGSTFISPQVRKTTPGLIDLSTNWNISGIPDGRYFIFADLIPGPGADGTEAKLTRPRAGRNNLGTAKLETNDVIVNVTTISGTTVTTQGTSRSETWVAECVDANAGKWLVGSSLTQPLPPEEPSAATCTTFPTRCATTGVQYTSLAGAVKFTIRDGTGASPKGAVGDTFTFTTTGITAPSEAVTISNGQIREDPTAIIDASPLSGPPPLEVDFDARRSVDPNGQPLTFQWTFCRPGTCGAGETATGPQVSHTYPTGGLYTVTLKATNPANGRFGETSVDIQVTNNSPNAVIKAAPTSGPEPLEVRFSATQSRDTETAPEELIYQWNYGNGLGANDGGLAGISFAEVTHTYSRVNTNLDTTNCTATCPCTPTGRACTAACPCAFTAVLTVTDAGGKKDTDSAVIRVGNTNPTAKITTIPTLLQGLNPFTVTFNAKESSDAEGDNLEVEWQWGDGSANEKWPAKTGKPPAVDGGVPHTFTLPAGTTFKTYTVKAIVRDLNANGTLKGGETTSQLVVTVFTEGAQPPQANRPPKAAFIVTPAEAFEGEEVTFDAGLSSDPDEPTGDVLRYRWTFGDGSPLPPFSTNPVATHTYASVGTYVVRLTVRDQANASSESTQTVRVLLEGANRSPVAMIATGPRTGSAPLTLTLDGSISFDPDGDVITSYTWEFGQGDVLVETVDTGSVPEVTRVFATPGEYTVVLVVKTGVDGAEGRTAPESILVTDPAAPPPPEPPPPRPEPQEPPNSASQRPLPTTCGLGVLMGSLGSLLGLTLTVVTRRRLKT